jgi:hypothetical protein
LPADTDEFAVGSARKQTLLLGPLVPEGLGWIAEEVLPSLD